MDILQNMFFIYLLCVWMWIERNLTLKNMCKLNVKSECFIYIQLCMVFLNFRSVVYVSMIYLQHYVGILSRVSSSISRGRKSGSIRRKIVARWIQSCQCGSVIVSKRFPILVIYAVLHSACERCNSVVPSLSR